MAFVAIAIVSTAATIGGAYMSIQGQRNAAKAAEDAADWNADQANKQAAYDEGVAQQNMRRERDNNRRELARRRASAARGGLAESGAVSDNLIEASSRHQQEIDDIWERTAASSSALRAKGQMGIWEAAVGSEAAKTNAWATGIGAVGSVANTAMKFKSPSPAPKGP